MISDNLNEKIATFSDHWSPKTIAGLNDYHVKLAKVEGRFPWHRHAETDELFLDVIYAIGDIHGDPDPEAGPRSLIIESQNVTRIPWWSRIRTQKPRTLFVNAL